MDKTSSIVAALDAGKLPSQQQISTFVDWFLASPLSQIEPGDNGNLSHQGKLLVGDLREVLTAYKILGEHKNDDNLIQQALWHLSQADISDTTAHAPDAPSPGEAKHDAAALSHAIRTLLSILWANITQESQSVFHDFASFLRLALADAAEHVSATAGSAAESLRKVDEQIANGQRNEAGLKNKPEEEQWRNKDAKEKWESAADTVKVAGSKTIGAGQAVADKSEDLANRSNQRMQDAFYQICDRAQDDDNYRASVTTIFDILSKWLHAALDTAGDINTDTSLDAFIDDPTPEQHLIKSIRSIREFLERCAGGKSLDGVFGALRVCGADIKTDEGVRAWAEDALAYARRCIEERGYARSDAAQKAHKHLQTRWDKMRSAESEESKKWRKDVGLLKKQWTEFEQALGEGEDLARVRRAGTKLGTDLESAFGAVLGAAAQKGVEGAQSAGETVWMWQDLFNAYLPRVLSVVKDIPIPRTEYADDDVELVLEDLDVSSFALLPGHAYIRNITDIDITAPATSSPSETQTTIGSLTRVYASGVQLALKDVSFWFRQKNSTLGLTPSELSGVLELTIPEKGVDIDVVVKSIPSSPEGLKERERRRAFLDVQRVEVHVSDAMTLSVRESNHSVLASVFSGVITARVRAALEAALATYVRDALEYTDSIAWDVGVRAEVFADAGLGRGASLVAGAWSELGRMARRSGGEWRATGTGIVREGKDGARLAVGAEPQVLSGAKRGPRGNFSEPLADKLDDVDMDVDGEAVQQKTMAVGERAKELVGEAGEQVKETVKKVKGFGEAVREKAEMEKGREGWESSAFDVAA